MTVLVAAETVLLVLLLLLVAGLLRSHAEILRRLGPDGLALDDSVLPEPAERAGIDPEAHDVAGLTLDGDARGVAFDRGRTLLAFLSSGCTSCGAFWSAFAPGSSHALPEDLRLVVLAKDGSHESPSRLRDLAPPGVEVLLSSAAWEDYAVPGSPYFVLVEGGEVRGEGSATGWPQLASLLRDADSDISIARSNAERARRADDTLAAAGIGPGHASLYPSGTSDPPA